MKNQEIRTKIRQFKYHILTNFLSLNTILWLVGVFTALAWMWGSISAMNRNYQIQQDLELQTRRLAILELEHAALEFEQQYFKSAEYQELAARENLGLVMPGENILILNDYPEEKQQISEKIEKEHNFTQWMNFLFGGNVRR